MKTIRHGLVVLVLASSAASPAPQDPPSPSPDTTSLAPDGTARITRIVPVPTTISPQAQAFLRTGASWAPAAGSEEQRLLIEKARVLYPVRIEDAVIGSVAVRVVTPFSVPPERADRVLVNLHGGGFVSDSGSMLESIPIASLTRTKVVTVLYRLAPANRFPGRGRRRDRRLPRAAEDAQAAAHGAVRHLGGRHPVRAGGGEDGPRGAPPARRDRVLHRLRRLREPGGLAGVLRRAGARRARPPERGGSRDAQYLGDRDPRDPLASPIYADLAGWPPTLCVSGTRDLLLSGTVNFHRALLRNGVDARLVVFDAMPHAHWYMMGIPEATEALELMARFFDERLGR